MLKRFGPVLAGLVAVAALVIAVPSATGHPEECATAAAWTNADGGYSPYLSWQGAEESVCLSKSVTSRFDDSDAKLTKPNEVGTAGLRLIASRGKQGPFAPYAAFNSDLAFENGFAYQGNYEGVTIWDVRDPSNPDARRSDRLPGLAERRHRQRRDPGHVDRLAPHQRHVQQRGHLDADGAHHLGGPEGLRRQQPGGAAASRQRADRLRLAHPHGAAGGRVACSCTSSPTTSAARTTAAPTPARSRTTRSRSSRSRRRTRPRRRSSARRSCSPTAATRVSRAARSGRPRAATTSPSTRRSASRPAPAPARARSSTSRTR